MESKADLRQERTLKQKELEPIIQRSLIKNQSRTSFNPFSPIDLKYLR